MTLAVLLLYLVLVLLVGGLSHRLFKGTGEDYFVASRTIGPFLLLMSLFGTNMTAFAILGASGESYRQGIGVFGLMASSSALVIPAILFFVGPRVWALGKRHGFVTLVEFVRQRWDSKRLALVLFAVLTLLLVPYLLIGVLGGGLTLSQLTGGQIPSWVGSLLVCAVVLAYVCGGGMRGTAWANGLQTMVFMSLGAVAFVLILSRLGGLEQALSQLSQRHPELLARTGINPWTFWSYTFIPLSAGAFPHLFAHWLTARSSGAFRLPVVLYPLCIAVVWIPSVILGIVGRLDFPDLAGPAANGVLVKLIELHAPGVLAGLLGAGVFAAIMSSLDSQVLAIGAMFTRDIVGRQGTMSQSRQVVWGRLFVAAVLALTFGLSLVAEPSIFKLAIWSFSGFAALFPLLLAALFWRRSTEAGALAAIALVTLLWFYFFVDGWQVPGYTVGGSGLLPVVVLCAVSGAALILVSLVTRPPAKATLDHFFSR